MSSSTTTTTTTPAEPPKSLTEFRGTISQLCQLLESRAAEQLRKDQELESERRAFADLQRERVKYPIEEEIISLNVGGRRFDTLKSTLTSQPHSLLAAMFSGQFPLVRDTKGAIVLDRSPAIFEYILDVLRTGKIPSCPENLRKLLRDEMKFFGVDRRKGAREEFTWDSGHKSTNLSLSEDQMTATVMGSTQHSSCFGTQGFTSGVHRWCCEITINGNHWIALGVRALPSDYSTDYSGAWAHSSSNQRYGSTTDSGDVQWNSGDIIEHELDMDNGTLTMTCRRTGSVEHRNAITGEVFPWVNLYNTGNCCRLFFE